VAQGLTAAVAATIRCSVPIGRPLCAATVGGLAAAAALAAPSAAAACGASQQHGPVAGDGPGAAPLAVGDSVMLGAVPQLRRAGFEVNARGCRKMSEGLEVLGRRRRAGSLPEVVVVALGHNWTITIEQIRSALMILGPGRVLGMVTPRGEYASARAAINAAGDRWPARVRVLPWARRSAGKPWTWDGLHLTPAGARAFARLLSGAFDWPLPGADTKAEEPQPEEPEPQAPEEGGAVAP
jgi:hypothetical protein